MKITSMAFKMLLIGWSMGLGSRMVYEFTLGGHETYTVVPFDLFFDWSGLMILGVINAVIFFKETYSVLKVKA
jgi:hypothetical protein